MSELNYFESPSRNKTLVIVEGKTEKTFLLKALLLCFPEIPIKIEDVYIYSSNIYDLYRAIEDEYEETWFEDDLSIDIPLLISRKQSVEPPLDKRAFTNIIMIFDYEHHDTFYSDEKIMKMQRHFSNASEDGLLYINFPMLESVYHFKEIPDREYISRSIPITCSPGKRYKELVKSESVIMDYLGLFNKVNEFLKKIIPRSDDVIETLSYELLLSRTLEEIENAVEQMASNFGLAEKRVDNMKHQLSATMSTYPFINKATSYWNDLRELFLYVIKENINKSACIQKVTNQGLSVKAKYDSISWDEILKRQNEFSADDKNGIIFVLCTCITFLGEYKFYWAQSEYKQVANDKILLQ